MGVKEQRPPHKKHRGRRPSRCHLGTRGPSLRRPDRTGQPGGPPVLLPSAAQLQRRRGPGGCHPPPRPGGSVRSLHMPSSPRCLPWSITERSRPRNGARGPAVPWHRPPPPYPSCARGPLAPQLPVPVGAAGRCRLPTLPPPSGWWLCRGGCLTAEHAGVLRTPLCSQVLCHEAAPTWAGSAQPGLEPPECRPPQGLVGPQAARFSLREGHWSFPVLREGRAATLPPRLGSPWLRGAPSSQADSS